MLPFLSLLAAISFWRQSLVLQCAALGFAALYGWLYRQLVRFRGQRLVALRRAVGWSAAGRGRLRPNG